MTPAYPFPLTSKQKKFPFSTTADPRHPFDRSKPRKYWIDPNALAGHNPSDPYPVQVVDQNGSYVTITTITCQQASEYNIDGTPAFPNPAQAPSDIYILLNGGEARALITPTDLIRDEDLATLTAKIAADTGQRPKWTEQLPLTDDGSGGAATWKYYRADTQQSAGSLWNEMCWEGVGWPGKWIRDPVSGYHFQFADANVVFTPDPAAHFPLDPIPCPMDPLLPDEQLGPSTNPMNPGPWVYLKQGSTSGGSGAGNPQLAADIAAIRADLEKIKTRLGV